MSLKSYLGKGLEVLLLLAMLFSLAGCLSSRTTLIAETEGRVVESVCSVWTAITYSSKDTERTRLEVRANNAARGEFCAP